MRPPPLTLVLLRPPPLTLVLLRPPPLTLVLGWCRDGGAGRALGCWKRQVCRGETFWRGQWVLVLVSTKIFAFLVVKVLWNDVGDVACLWVNWLRCEVNGKIPKTF